MFEHFDIIKLKCLNANETIVLIFKHIIDLDKSIYLDTLMQISLKYK